jgi:hypothetical protein
LSGQFGVLDVSQSCGAPEPVTGMVLLFWGGGTLPSFLPSTAEIPRDPSSRPPTNVTHKTGTQSAAYSELRARDWNSFRTRRADRNRANAHKMTPHRTVPKGRGPRLSREVKADLKYSRGCLSPHLVFRPENPTSAHPPYLRLCHPGPDSK